ncbi:MAG: class I SAM-dependent methyltransferase [Candidatus Aenigmarchaeota archaeon]|nr:class I SAM-dependent methyltransferase [Candidatus Aenigmarchaeota archaeon]
MGIYTKYYLKRKKSRRDYEIIYRVISCLYYYIFGHTFGIVRSLYQMKRPVVMKFDVWEEVNPIMYETRHVTEMIRENFRPSKVLYIDIEKKLVRYAKEVLITEKIDDAILLNGDIRTLPLKNNSLDIIVDFSTTDHLNDRDFLKTISEVYRVLKNGGVYIIYHLNKDYILIDEWNEAVMEGLIPSFPRKIDFVINLLKDIGFEIIYSRYLWSFMFDSNLVWMYVLSIHRHLFRILPKIIKFRFFNSKRMNLFFVIIAKKC